MPVTVLFTKLFGSLPLESVGEAAADLGFDGIDLLIRPGSSVVPDEPAGIPAAVLAIARAGLRVPTATTDLTSVDVSGLKEGRGAAEAVLGACAEAGIGLVRLGYWYYDGTRPYRKLFDDARRDLDGLERLASRFGLVLTVQLHGGTIHSSGALTARLLEGHDPALLGAYIDPGNQAVQDGREDWRLTFDLLAPWLRCVGVKNGGWAAAGTDPSGQRLWSSDWLGVPDGCVPWHDILAYLTRSAYEGPLSFHGHYELPFEHVLDQTRTDLRYVRRLLEADR
ncbi:sugar phosphate isomerase/epimerase family protein [Jiangella asiatica]|uniref:Sugar phosphate isomerase/epimerase n=1 Tax=Jiangella asiatica TaxID=2530372 RepID=A0A4R5CUK5_9ACTN|nr:sugar phosphate isomerase/epimerase [Jiangella asiatica]TDE03110.1 sugar phosphate isomerase/epimerase [Jiangella asiatica]